MKKMNSALVVLLCIAALMVLDTEQIIGGREAREGEFPWHVAVCERAEHSDRYFCAGTLITNKFVLTSRICMMDSEEFRDAFKVFVKLDLHSSNIVKPFDLQIRNVRKIHNLEYTTVERTKKDDIALLEMTVTVIFSEFIQPVCIHQVAESYGQIGVLPGWGCTELGNCRIKLSPVLKVVNLPVISLEACMASNDEFKHLLDDSCLCAGYPNSTGTNYGDAGGGLVYRRNDTWFIGAIASFRSYTATWYDDFTYAVDGYSVFTNLYQFIPWLRTITNFESVEGMCGKTPAIIAQCGMPRNRINQLIVNGQSANSEDWPWHVAIYHRKPSKPAEYACGGSLIHRLFVLTAHHCTKDANTRSQLSARVLTVKMGVQELYDSWNKGFQQHPIFKIHTPRRMFQGLKNDITLLELRSEVEFTDYVLPICLPTRDVERTVNGVVVGFGLTGVDELADSLMMATLPVVPDFRCLRSDPVNFGEMDEGLFCAGDANGTTPCNGDSGGGLVFQRAGVWELGGMVSFSLPNSSNFDRCQRDTFVAFTNVFHYLTWIQSVIGM